MSSSGRIREMTPFSVSARHLVADGEFPLHRDEHLTIFRTPGGSSSPRRIREIFSIEHRLDERDLVQANAPRVGGDGPQLRIFLDADLAQRSFGISSSTSSVIFFRFARSTSDLSSEGEPDGGGLPRSWPDLPRAASTIDSGLVLWSQVQRFEDPGLPTSGRGRPSPASPGEDLSRR